LEEGVAELQADEIFGREEVGDKLMGCPNYWFYDRECPSTRFRCIEGGSKLVSSMVTMVGISYFMA